MEKNPRSLWFALALGAGAVACAPEHEINRVSQTEVFYQAATDEIDILWVIDNSLSMSDEQDKIASEFKSFITSIEDYGLQFQIGVITTDVDDTDQRGKLRGDPTILTPETEDYTAEFKRLVKVGTDGSDKEAGIDAAQIALTSPLIDNYNQGFLRDGATLSIIYVSDENDCTNRGVFDGEDGSACYERNDELVPVRYLADEYAQIKSGDERVLVSAIVGPPADDGCEGSVPGHRYYAMAEAYGGVKGSICDDSFAEIMGELGVQASGLLDSFQLQYPAVVESIEITVDDTQIFEDETDGWTYDETYAIVYFHGDGVPERGSTITISYQVAAGVEIEDATAE